MLFDLEGDADVLGRSRGDGEEPRVLREDEREDVDRPS
jgi:hypothetical protein